MKIEDFCKRATQDEMIELFNALSKSLVKQYKIKQKSSLKELNTNFSNKKQHDTIYSKSFNDNRVYNQILSDIKVLTIYLM